MIFTQSSFLTAIRFHANKFFFCGALPYIPPAIGNSKIASIGKVARSVAHCQCVLQGMFFYVFYGLWRIKHFRSFVDRVFGQGVLGALFDARQRKNHTDETTSQKEQNTELVFCFHHYLPSNLKRKCPAYLMEPTERAGKTKKLPERGSNPQPTG